MANLTSFLRYPGGKRKLLPMLMKHLSPLLNLQNSFCDAFVGGGSVLIEVAKQYPKHSLFINDKDYGIYSIWKILASDSDTDFNQLLHLIDKEPTIDYFYQLRDTPPNNIVESAYQAIFFNRCCFSGINITRIKNNKIFTSNPIGGKNQNSKYKVNCRYNSKKIKSQLTDVRKLLKNRCFVYNQDISALLLNLPDIPLYCDPPYWYKADQLYNTYMVNEEHKTLSFLLKNKKNWVLSYDNCLEVKELYSWAKLHEIDAKYSISSDNEEWRNCKELLITPE